MIKITDLQDSRVEIFSNIRNKQLEKQSLIIVESNKVVLKLLKSNRKILKIFSVQSFLQENSELIKKADEVYYADMELMKKIVGSEKHHGVFALAEKPVFNEVSELDEKVIILNGLTSPENVGAIIRTAAAFNINSLIFDAKTVSPFSRRCIRVSMGNIFSMKIHKTNDLKATLKVLEENNFHTYATANIENSQNVNNIKFSNKSAIIIGSEGHGIDKEILEASNSIIKIPINEDVAHLNAGHASAIFLYLLSKE